MRVGIAQAWSKLPTELIGWHGLGRGVWFRVRQGIRGILIPDERGAAVVSMIREPSSHYYQVMTRSPGMPVPIDERI